MPARNSSRKSREVRSGVTSIRTPRKRCTPRRALGHEGQWSRRRAGRRMRIRAWSHADELDDLVVRVRVEPQGPARSAGRPPPAWVRTTTPPAVLGRGEPRLVQVAVAAVTADLDGVEAGLTQPPRSATSAAWTGIGSRDRPRRWSSTTWPSRVAAATGTRRAGRARRSRGRAAGRPGWRRTGHHPCGHLPREVGVRGGRAAATGRPRSAQHASCRPWVQTASTGSVIGDHPGRTPAPRARRSRPATSRGRPRWCSPPSRRRRGRRADHPEAVAARRAGPAGAGGRAAPARPSARGAARGARRARRAGGLSLSASTPHGPGCSRSRKAGKVEARAGERVAPAASAAHLKGSGSPREQPLADQPAASTSGSRGRGPDEVARGQRLPAAPPPRGRVGCGRGPPSDRSPSSTRIRSSGSSTSRQGTPARRRGASRDRSRRPAPAVAQATAQPGRPAVRKRRTSASARVGVDGGQPVGHAAQVRRRSTARSAGSSSHPAGRWSSGTSARRGRRRSTVRAR